MYDPGFGQQKFDVPAGKDEDARTFCRNVKTQGTLEYEHCAAAMRALEVDRCTWSLWGGSSLTVVVSWTSARNAADVAADFRASGVPDVARMRADLNRLLRAPIETEPCAVPIQ